MMQWGNLSIVGERLTYRGGRLRVLGQGTFLRDYIARFLEMNPGVLVATCARALV